MRVCTQYHTSESLEEQHFFFFHNGNIQEYCRYDCLCTYYHYSTRKFLRPWFYYFILRECTYSRVRARKYNYGTVHIRVSERQYFFQRASVDIFSTTVCTCTGTCSRYKMHVSVGVSESRGVDESDEQRFSGIHSRNSNQ